MMFGLVLTLHILASIFLIIVVLLQGGRGGLGEALGGAGMQSLFGGSGNVVMAKITTVAATVFALTCLSLAALSTAHGRSVIERQSPATLPDVFSLPLQPEAASPQGAPPAAPPASPAAVPAPAAQPVPSKVQTTTPTSGDAHTPTQP